MIGPEGWHFRYVGTPHAQIMYENNWCLEEYMNALTKSPIYKATQDGALYKIARITSMPLKDDSIISASSDNTGGYIVTSKIQPFSFDWLTKNLIPKFKQMLIAGVTIG